MTLSGRHVWVSGKSFPNWCKLLLIDMNGKNCTLQPQAYIMKNADHATTHFGHTHQWLWANGSQLVKCGTARIMCISWILSLVLRNWLIICFAILTLKSDI